MTDSILDTIERLGEVTQAARDNVAGQIEFIKSFQSRVALAGSIARQLPDEITTLRRKAAGAWADYDRALEEMLRLGAINGPELDAYAAIAEDYDRAASAAYDRWQADGGLSVPDPKPPVNKYEARIFVLQQNVDYYLAKWQAENDRRVMLERAMIAAGVPLPYDGREKCI